jgi:type I restriction enzyme S subunit
MPEAITDNLDLWSSALLTRSTAGRGSNSKLEAYGIKKLRVLILELAVHGKLVPQDPNDESASVLLERIAKEKARLLKEGRIAKKESLPRLSEEEKRFDLPNGWVWARFGEIFELEYGDNLPEAKRKSTGEYPVFGSNGVVGSHDSYCIDKPCIVVGRKGSAGALNLCLNDKCWVTDVAYSVIPPSALDLKFVFKLFHTLGLDSLGKGIKPGLNRNEAYVLPIAIPSLKEQHRIVAKVDELMALCDQLEQQQTHSIEAHQTLVASLLGTLTRVVSQQEFNAAWARIASHFDTLFTTEASIDQLKQTVLQLAVMGKLVQQDKNEESASILLEKISEQKVRLVDAGEIRKQKPLSNTDEEEQQFELPVGWKWCRLHEIVYLLGDGLHGTPEYTLNEKYYFVNGNNLNDGQIVIKSETKTVAQDQYNKYKKPLGENSVLVSINGTLGNVAFYNNEAVILGKSACFFNLAEGIYKQFIKLVIDAPSFADYSNKNATGSTIKNLGLSAMNSLPIALPPKEEQHRIVAKVDELMELCDTLKARLADAKTIQLHLADAIVEQAVC